MSGDSDEEFDIDDPPPPLPEGLADRFFSNDELFLKAEFLKNKGFAIKALAEANVNERNVKGFLKKCRDALTRWIAVANKSIEQTKEIVHLN